MQNLTDHPSLEKYSDQFSDIIINDFFLNKEKITGQEILDLTPVRQVNLFIIKDLLFQWKKESEALRSPYFDFSNEEVQKAMTAFMNIVSRHISMDEVSLKPLMAKAVQDSILLIFFPYVFYTKLIEEWPEEHLLLKDLRQVNKYIKVNQSLMDSLISELESKGASGMDKNEAIELFNSIVEDSELSPADTDEHEQKFDQILTFRLQAFINEEENISTDAEPSIETQEENDVSWHSEEPSDESNWVEATSSQEDPEEETFPEKEELAEEVEERTNEEPVLTSLHDTYQEKERPTLADIHERKKIEKISKYISINQKFMFINRLFDKDWGKFEKAISFLDETNSKDEIFSYLDEHAPSWREEGDEADEFRLVLEKKLGEPIE